MHVTLDFVICVTRHGGVVVVGACAGCRRSRVSAGCLGVVPVETRGKDGSGVWLRASVRGAVVRGPGAAGWATAGGGVAR